jgi:integrase
MTLSYNRKSAPNPMVQIESGASNVTLQEATMPELQVITPSASQQSTQPKPKRERGDGRVFLRGSTFWISYYCRGREYRESARTADESVACKFLRHRIKQVGADQLGARSFVGPHQERILVNELLDDLCVEYKRGGKRRIPRDCSPQMLSCLKRVRDYFGSMRAIDVRASHVEDFIAFLRSKHRANSTINRSLELLGRAFRLAVNADPPKMNRALRVPKLDESSNVRKGKFSQHEAELVFAGLPDYMSDVARFAYETGTRSGEIRKLQWGYLEPDAICVPGTDTKNRKGRSIVLTPELETIIERRKKARVDGCELIFHHDGAPIADYRKAWQKACVLNGLGRVFCRDCRDEKGQFISALDADGVCPRCQTKCESPKYIGRIFHDFRRSCAHEMWKAGNSIDDCMKVTGHISPAMFKRYADLFSEEEVRERQRQVQQRRREWREAQAQDELLTMPTATTQ